MGLWVLAGPGEGSAAAAESVWSFEVEPAVWKGQPAVRAENSSEPQALAAKFFDVGTSTPRLLEERPVAPTTSTLIAFPAVKSDTYGAVSLTTTSEAQTPLFEWRTLVRPEGKTLLSYEGKKELLPPPDFEAFWQKAKKELDAVALRPNVERQADRDTSTGLFYRVELPSVEETTIVCWMYVPKAAYGADGKVTAKFPAIQIAPGYGAEEPAVDRTTSGLITLSVNPRNHGPSREYWKSPVDHMLYNLTDPDHYYYKLAFLDCLRAAQFLFTREEVDKKRVATEGGSQGGLFAIATAALEPRIACVCSNVTAFSDYPDATRLATAGHHVTFRTIFEEAQSTLPLVEKSLAYTDGANMATRVKCPLQVNMGGKDPVCPYVAGIVVLNRAGTPDKEKEYHIVPGARHEVPPAMREWNAQWYRKWLKVE